MRRQWALTNPIDIAMARAARMTKKDIDTQVLPLLSSVERLVTGRWTRADWGAVRDATNRIEILMRMCKVEDPGFLPEIGAVVDAAIERFGAQQTMALRKDERVSLHWLAETYANVLAEVTRGQFMDACTIAEREVARMLAEHRNKARKEAAAC